MQLPRPLWIGLAAFGLMLAVVWINLGLPIYRQQVAIGEIELLHGRIIRRSGTPAWVKTWLGDRCDVMFDDVSQVWLSEKPATDDSLRYLKGLTNLEELWLNKTHVTDDGMAIVEGMPKLKNLWLDDAHITDAGLTYLRSLNKLESLLLGNTRVTDSGLANVAQLTCLKKLRLAGTEVTDAGLAQLTRLVNLEELYLQHAGKRSRYASPDRPYTAALAPSLQYPLRR
jgi:hypothetical protein